MLLYIIKSVKIHEILFFNFIVCFAFLRKKRACFLAKIKCDSRRRRSRSFANLYFFRTKEKDTLAAVNKKNEIISTNWIFNIDKRLPLRLVIPEVMKLQEKKRNEVVHKNEAAKNYYSYADSIHKNMAFLPFTAVVYKLRRPKFSFLVSFTKNNEIFVEGTLRSRDELKQFLMTLPKEKLKKVSFRFDANMNYGTYIQNQIFIESLKMDIREEYID